MPKQSWKLPILVLTCLTCVAAVVAQTPDASQRDAEWRAHQFPSVEFARHVDPQKVILLRVPADWRRTGLLTFKGPHESQLNVVVETIPDGLPLKSFTAAVLQNLRNLPGGPEALQVRRTEISALEAREFMFTIADPRGEMTRRQIWTTVTGPHAISIMFIQPASRTAEVEPFFKAVVESAVIFESQAHYEIFEKLRGQAISESKPARLDRVRTLVEIVIGFDATERSKAVGALAEVFDTAPDSAIDLLIDRRPLVRGAAVEAVGRGSNRRLDGFLLQALADESSDVAARAARALAKREDAVKLLREDSDNWNGLQLERMMRALAMLDDRSRAQIAAELLKRGEAASGSASVRRQRSATPPAPPPPPVGRKPAPGASRNSETPGRNAGKSTAPPKAPKGFVSAKAPEIADAKEEMSLIDTPGNEEMVLLGLMPDLEALQTALPATRLLESGSSEVAATLRLALNSRTRLPVEPLLKLLSHPGTDINRLAAQNLAVAATSADIPRIEGIARNLVSVKASPDGPGANPSGRTLREQLELTIKEIRWRERMTAATGDDARDKLFKEGLDDAEMADFAWSYARDRFEAPGPKDPKPLRPREQKAGLAGYAPASGNLVSALGENLLPRDVNLYAAIPDPQGLINKFAGSLWNIQLESARSQATLLLMLKHLESMITRKFDTPADQSILAWSGVKPHSPMVLASWTAQGAPRGLKSAERKAVLVRVTDRDRFEHLIATYQQHVGNFEMLPEYISLGARFLPLFPASLPIAMQAMDSVSEPSERSEPKSFHLVGSETCNGFPVTVVERRDIRGSGYLKRDTVYFTYVGDTAVMAPDWYSLRDLLSGLDNKRENLAANPEFKRAAAAGSDVVYFSEPLALFGKKTGAGLLKEGGGLRINNSGWESSLELAFNGLKWFKPIGFKPSELKAPARLLPKSAVIYLFAKLELPTLWKSLGSVMFSAETVKAFESIWAIDFERDVLPELGPECGAALLDLPSPEQFSNVPWAIFVQTRSEKLDKAFAEGKLFKGTTEASKPGQLKVGNTVLTIAVRNGFLVIAPNDAALKKLDSIEYLSSARDFARALDKVPGEVSVFGGANIGAAVDSIKNDKNEKADPVLARALEAMTSLARAFHGLNLSATANDNGLSARTSVSLDREGRFSLQELASIAKEVQFSAPEIVATGAPIPDQRHLDSLTIKITSKAAGAIDRIKEDITSSFQQTRKVNDSELVVTIRPRRPERARKVELPVTASEYAQFLAASRDINPKDPQVLAKAREIAGDDRDAWSVAQKLSDWTFKNLKWKVVDSDARQTLATREADCLEFSELFVAMARSLGLPARIVTGMAHGGSSFGGHAWVEVWIGDWIELDPTWGTNFVDATHIRSGGSELSSYGVLNVVSIEVLESRRAIADFQRDPAALASALAGGLNRRGRDVLSVAIDAPVIVDDLNGNGAWNGLTDRERDQLHSAFRRLLGELHETLAIDEPGNGNRVLKTNRNGTNADVLLLSDRGIPTIRLYFVQKGDVWFVKEIRLEDLNYLIIAEYIRPILREIAAKRTPGQATGSLASFESRIVRVIVQDPKMAIQIADQALKDSPNSQAVRYLKALSLRVLAEGGDDSDGADKAEKAKAALDESIRILTALADERPPFPQAVLKLGEQYADTLNKHPDAETRQEKAIEFLKQYAQLVADDPTPHTLLAGVYQKRDEIDSADAELRIAVNLDPGDGAANGELAGLLIQRKRYADALALIDRFEARGPSKTDLFANLFFTLYMDDDGLPQAEELAAAAPERMRNNATANHYLGSMRLLDGKASAALPLFQRAIELQPDDPEHHIMLAECYRKLHNWPAALKAADKALALDTEDTDALYERACALAQLKRPVEALAALRKAFELDEEAFMSEGLETEETLKPLARLPGFKKLVEDVKKVEEGESPDPPEQKPAETPAAPAKKPAQPPTTQPARKPAEK